jgi:hypothetical protein
LVCLLAVACSSSRDSGVDAGSVFCKSVAAAATGVTVANCTRPTVSLHDVQFGSEGMRQSYAFLVTCGDQTARGSWDATAGMQCLEGANLCEGGPCTPTSSIDCRLQPDCEQSGECEFSDGKCVLSEDGCAHSLIDCGLNGACHLGPNGTCVVTSDADCRSPYGSCPSCSFKGSCVSQGNCYFENGQCVAKSDGDCKNSDQCAFAGMCSLVGNSCAAASDADCAGSEVCRTSGLCKVNNNGQCGG